MSAKFVAVLSVIGAALLAAGVWFSIGLLTVLGVLCLVPLAFFATVGAMIAAAYALGRVVDAIASTPEALDAIGGAVRRTLEGVYDGVASFARWIGKGIASAWKPTLAAAVALAAAALTSLPTGVIKDFAGVTPTVVIPAAVVPAVTVPGEQTQRTLEARPIETLVEPITGGSNPAAAESAPVTAPDSKGLVRALDSRGR